MRYALIIYWSKADESFFVEVPELFGCMADGATFEKAVDNAQVVIADRIETDRSLTPPTPSHATYSRMPERVGHFCSMSRRAILGAQRRPDRRSALRAVPWSGSIVNITRNGRKYAAHDLEGKKPFYERDGREVEGSSSNRVADVYARREED